MAKLARFDSLADDAPTRRTRAMRPAPEASRWTRASGDDDAPPLALCIDDDDDFCTSLQIFLEAHGVAAARATDGTEGYRLAFAQPCSVILLDVNLPGGQGDYVLRRLKESPATAEIPVVVITGVCDRSVERRIVGQGAAAYLHKPIDFADLRDELARHIEILPAPQSTAVLA